MREFKLSLGIAITAGLLLLQTGPIQAQGESNTNDINLGSIDFPTSASGEAQQEFLTGVLALHSFWYPEARDHFQEAQKLNPNFAMAYWGEAMTYDHPIWQQHDQAKGKQVLDKLDQKIDAGTVIWSDREKAYIDAIRFLYNTNLHMAQRRRNYYAAMEKLYKSHPNDDEALAFSALAAMSKPGFEYYNPDVRDVVPIASKLEGLYQRNPKHPGAMHYLIHVYDSDKFAELGLRPAHDYAEVAYSSSHAIHMPSHIFKQLEMWDKVIESNIKAYNASVEWQQRTNRPLRERDYHSYRWLFEAYLEIDEYAKACNIISEMSKLNRQVQEREEEPGRIPGLLQDFKKQYKNQSGNSATQCTE